MVVRCRGRDDTYLRNEQKNETHVTNNERVCTHNPTFAQQRRACARRREKDQKGFVQKRTETRNSRRTGEVGLNSQVYVYNLNYKFDRVTEA